MYYAIKNIKYLYNKLYHSILKYRIFLLIIRCGLFYFGSNCTVILPFLHFPVYLPLKNNKMNKEMYNKPKIIPVKLLPIP